MKVNTLFIFRKRQDSNAGDTRLVLGEQGECFISADFDGTAEYPD